MTNDHQLIQLAEVFVKAFGAALVTSDEEFRALLKGSGKGFSSGAHGTVEFTDELIEASRNLANRASKVFGANRIHQKSVEEVARSIAFSSSDTDSPKATAKAIAVGIGNAATTHYRIIRPNPLFRLIGDFNEVRVGPVRIVKRDEIRQEVESTATAVRISPPTQENAAFTFIDDGSSSETYIHLPDICWDVSVQGMPKGLQLQAYWYIDVAISFVRLHYDEPTGLFPRLADVEPHPISPQPWQTPGLSIGPTGPAFGGGTAPPWYELDAKISDVLNSSKVVDVAQQVFNPESNSLAERMQQALGWLTRARRAQEPAERVLLFFTAIEALLSGASKDAPVTETISRYAGVIWSEKPETRLALYTSLKKHYALRSRIVHNGERSVADIEVNNVHYIAWTLARILLRRADLAVKHSDFIEALRKASFGTKLDA